MTRPQIALVLHALVLIAVLACAVPALTLAFGGPRGYLAALALYWLGFCVPVIYFHVRHRRGSRLYSERLAWRDWFVPLLLLLQVAVVALVIFVPNTAILTTHAAMLAAVIALINGPMEEVAWRGGFMTRFADRPRLGFVLSLVLSTVWHAPLTLSHGIVIPGGWLALLGGAAALGMIWTWLAWRTGSIFWTTLAHVLASTISLWVLFDTNGFVAALTYQP